MSVEEKLAKALIRQKKTLATAESSTGGLLSHKLTNVPGSSNFFQVGMVTYADRAKISLLGVRKQDIRRFGSVSEPVADQMAKNVRRLYGTDFGIGITGLAGPGGGTTEKPVGLTYIGVSSADTTVVRRFVFKGNRTTIKTRAATAAVKMLYSLL